MNIVKDEFINKHTDSIQLLSNQELQQGLKRVAEQINADYSEKELVLVCVLNGGIYTLGQLMPLIKVLPNIHQ